MAESETHFLKDGLRDELLPPALVVFKGYRPKRPKKAIYTTLWTLYNAYINWSSVSDDPPEPTDFLSSIHDSPHLTINQRR